MTTVADDDDTQDWAMDCNGEGQERAVRDSGDSRVVMMAVVVEDGSGRR
jgi:YD repeat-containing protein